MKQSNIIFSSIPFVVSAKTGSGVNEMFERIVRDYLFQNEKNSKKDKKKKGCVIE